MSVRRFRKKPVEVDAVQWTGHNEAELIEFTGGEFGVLDETDLYHCDDPESTAQVRDSLHSTWVLMRTGDWIIKGITGEFYPCRDSVFQRTYEEVPA